MFGVVRGKYVIFAFLCVHVYYCDDIWSQHARCTYVDKIILYRLSITYCVILPAMEIDYRFYSYLTDDLCSLLFQTLKSITFYIYYATYSDAYILRMITFVNHHKQGLTTPTSNFHSLGSSLTTLVSIDNILENYLCPWTHLTVWHQPPGIATHTSFKRLKVKFVFWNTSRQYLIQVVPNINIVTKKTLLQL